MGQNKELARFVQRAVGTVWRELFPNLLGAVSAQEVWRTADEPLSRPIRPPPRALASHGVQLRRDRLQNRQHEAIPNPKALSHLGAQTERQFGEGLVVHGRSAGTRRG